MTTDDLLQFLTQNVKLFESFAPETVKAIANASELRTFEGNESIIQCGDEGRFIGVLIDGHGEVSITDNTGSRLVMSQIIEGDVFGEMSVLTGDRSVADVIAGNRCTVLLVPQDVVSTLILTAPQGHSLFIEAPGRPRARAGGRHDQPATPRTCRRAIG